MLPRVGHLTHIAVSRRRTGHLRPNSISSNIFHLLQAILLLGDDIGRRRIHHNLATIHIISEFPVFLALILLLNSLLLIQD
jgi:hypothetical protein